MFKVGDKVRRIKDPHGTGTLKTGGVYIVRMVMPSHTTIGSTCITVVGHTDWFDAENFEHIAGTLYAIPQHQTDLVYKENPLLALQGQSCTTHQWTTYVGLMQTFDFCKVCDMKRGPND